MAKIGGVGSLALLRVCVNSKTGPRDQSIFTEGQFAGPSAVYVQYSRKRQARLHYNPLLFPENLAEEIILVQKQFGTLDGFAPAVNSGWEEEPL